MQYVMIVDIDRSILEGDDSIENAARIANQAFDRGTEGVIPITVRPLSEIFPC